MELPYIKAGIVVIKSKIKYRINIHNYVNNYINNRKFMVN